MSTLPNLIVIGAQKCGTSALHYYLGLHPEIGVSRPKELNFFLDEPDLAAAAPSEGASFAGPPGNWRRGIDWYASHFDGQATVRAESSPGYTSPWHPRAAERMATTIPDARLIMLVRDPIERALAHYRHRRSAGWETRGVADALGASGSGYIARSRYSACLAPYLEQFARESILLVAQEDLRDRRRETMRAIFGFLGVADDFWSDRMARERNVSSGVRTRDRLLRRLVHTPALRVAARLPEEVKWSIERLARRRSAPAAPGPLPAGLRASLADALRDDADQVRALAGRDFAGWSV